MFWLYWNYGYVSVMAKKIQSAKLIQAFIKIWSFFEIISESACSSIAPTFCKADSMRISKKNILKSKLGSKTHCIYTKFAPKLFHKKYKTLRI